MSRKWRRLLWGAGILLTISLVAWWEPWAERFEGRTVAQWLKVFQSRKEVDERVVAQFGARAVPDLVAAIEGVVKRRIWRSLTAEAIELVVRRDFSIDGRESEDLGLAAGTWLSMLAARGELRVQYDFSPKADLWMDQNDDSFWAPRWVQLVLTTPDESKTERDKALAAPAAKTQ